MNLEALLSFFGDRVASLMLNGRRMKAMRSCAKPNGHTYAQKAFPTIRADSVKTPTPITMRMGIAAERPYCSASNALIAVTPGAAELERTGITGIGNAKDAR